MSPGPDGARELVSGALRFTARAVFFDGEQRLAAMDASGVDAEVVSPMPPVLNYTVPSRPGLALCRWINEFIAGLCAVDPSRFLGLGTVPLQDPDLAAAELAAVRGLGLVGVEIASHVGGVSLAEDRFGGFFAEAARLGVPIFVHAMPAASARLPAGAAGTFGVGVDGALAAAALISGGVAERYPELRLAFSHGAGGFPLILPRAQWFWGRTWNEEQPVSEVTGPSPSELARRFYYDTLVFDRRALRYLIDLIGPDRLFIGSDFPAMPREEPAGRTLRAMGLPEDVLENITWHNCFRFLGIDAPKLFSSGEQPRLR